MRSQRWKDILDFSAREKTGVLVLIVVLILLVVVKIIQPWGSDKKAIDFSDYEAEIDRFESELVEMEADQTNQYSNSSSKNDKYSFDMSKKPFSFDPNLATREELESLGFSEAAQDNIINYRKAGGKFEQASDLAKLYTIDDEFFDHIESYIQLDHESSNSFTDYFMFNPNTVSKDSILALGFPEFIADRWLKFRNSGQQFTKPEDVKKIYGIDADRVDELIDYMIFELSSESANEAIELVPININTCQQTDLVKLPDVSYSLANKILSYRKLLGGYASENQFLEVYDMTEEAYLSLKEYAIIDASEVTKIPLNSVDYSGLLRHPYMSNDDVRAIMKFRDFSETIMSLDELLENKLISDSTLNKMRPYLSLD